MPEVDDECIFVTTADQVKFFTQTNGDRIIIERLNFSQEEATSLVWLINADNKAKLEFNVKLAPEEE